MTRFSTAAAVTAMTLLCAPAFAQAPTANAPAEHGTPAVAAQGTPGAVTPPGSPTPAPAVPGTTAEKGGPATDVAVNCQGLMGQASTALSGATDAKKAEAQKHVELARAAAAQNNEASCVSHMQMAMNSLK